MSDWVGTRYTVHAILCCTCIVQNRVVVVVGPFPVVRSSEHNVIGNSGDDGGKNEIKPFAAIRFY